MKIIFSLLLFLFYQTNYFPQNYTKEYTRENQNAKTNTFLVWQELDIEQAENTGFVYQDCNFKTMILQSVILGIMRPYQNDSLQLRLSNQIFEDKIKDKYISSEIVLKNKVKYEYDEVIYQELIAISIYSVNEEGKGKGKKELICSFSYPELKDHLLLDNPEAMICLGNGLKIPLIEVFENRSFKTRTLRKIKM